MSLTTNAVYQNSYMQTEDFLNMRDIHRKIFDRYRENEGLLDLTLHFSKRQKAENTTFHWWEDDFLLNSVIIQSVANGVGAGVAVDITINAASHQEAGIRSPFVVGNNVMIGEMRGRVSAVNKTVTNAHVYTIDPVDATENWAVTPTTVPALGVPVVTYGNSHADGTFQPAGLLRKPVKYLGRTQILKHQAEFHGSVSANTSEVEVRGKKYFYLKQVDDLSKRVALDIENTMFLGQLDSGLTDTTAPDGTGSVFNTEGLEKAIDNRGIDQPYVTWDYAEIEDMVKSLDVERALKEYCGLTGTNLHLAHEAAMHDRTQNTAIDFSMFSRTATEGKGKAVNFGFDSYRTGGYTTHIKKWETLNYQPLTGYSNSPYPDRGYFIPWAVIKDPSDQKNMNTVTMMYKANDRGSRFMKEWVRDTEITNKDSFEYNYLCEMGMRWAKVNSYVRATK